MRRGHRLRFYGEHCPWKALEAYLTENGKHELKDVEIYYRYGDDARRKTGWRRRNLNFHNISEVRLCGIRDTPLSFEFARTLPPQPPEHNLGIQEYKDFMSNREDTFDISHVLIFDWDIDHKTRLQWGGCSCQEKEICSSCWHAFAEPARASLHRVLTHWLGFKRVLFTFSGRRGFHAQVLDEGTRKLMPEQRLALYELIQAKAVQKNESMRRDMLQLLTPHHETHHRGAPYGVMKLLYELDKEVTLKMGHAMAMPLTPHYDTGNMRLPIVSNPFDPVADATKCNEVTQKNLEQAAKFLF